jgi:hypothetical protein
LTTVNDTITRAMKALGTLGRTEVPSAQEFTDGLYAYNQLLASWTNEQLMTYATLERSFPLQVGVQSYTIGTGGVINADRPTDITQAFVRDSSNNDFPMRIVPRSIWDTIGAKGVTSQIPDTLFYDSTFPLGVVYVFPVPLLSYTVYYDTPLNQSTASTGTQTISMPPGYERAFVSNLAIELMANGYPCLLNEMQLGALSKAASDGLANIKRTNIKEVIADYDESLVSRSYASYNIFRDGSN